MSTRPTLCAALALAGVALAPASLADTVELDLAGRAGEGLLPGNGVGPGTPPALDLTSTATGGEIGLGFVLDTDANTLGFDFAYDGLSGGLFDAGGGIHLHLVADDVDPFEATGPVIFPLNVPGTPGITLTSDFNEFGDPAGAVSGSLSFTEEQEDAFLTGRYYLNIHSGDFQAGELRGNLVVADGPDGPDAIPTPGAAALGLTLLGAGAARRRRRG